jgi:hypothetical protein
MKLDVLTCILKEISKLAMLGLFNELETCCDISLHFLFMLEVVIFYVHVMYHANFVKSEDGLRSWYVYIYFVLNKTWN